ncbi:hypothetical protein EV360DRAFT_51104, partial [Lentinula raphanica]
STPADRLRAFEQRVPNAGPMLLNTTLQTYGLTPDEMRQSKWNLALIAKLAREAERIQAETNDGRFGRDTADWKRLFRTRFSRFYKSIADFRQRADETPTDRKQRLEVASQRRRQSSKASGLRRWVSFSLL